MVYAIKSKSGHLPRFYYLVVLKSYSKEKNTCKLISIVQHYKILVNSFYNNHFKKLTATFLLIDSTLAMASLIFKLTRPNKQKQGQLAKIVNK